MEYCAAIEINVIRRGFFVVEQLLNSVQPVLQTHLPIIQTFDRPVSDYASKTDVLDKSAAGRNYVRTL